MDRILKEERKYIAEIIKKVVKSGANVLLIQKSILRESVNQLALHFLAKKGIMVVRDIERDDVPFIAKTIGAVPVSHIDHLTQDKLGTCQLVEEKILQDDSKVLMVNYISILTLIYINININIYINIINVFILIINVFIFQMTGVKKDCKTVTIFLRGSN